MKKNIPPYPQAWPAKWTLACASTLLLLCDSMAQTQPTLNVSQELTLTASPAVQSFGLRSNGVIYNAGPLLPGYYPLIDLSTVAGDANGDISTFLWDSGRTAFRIGIFNGSSLVPSTEGLASLAYGYRNVASGTASLAGGLLTQSPGYGSVALGSVSISAGAYSFSVGDNAATVQADAFAAGFGVTAAGHASAAFNYLTLASGFSTFAGGFATRADSFASVAFGRFNLAGYTGPNGDWEWNPEDPLFELGNGTGYSARSNALTVYKNGNATFQGVVRVAPGGDIPMFGH